jgi:hypothetical protein
MVRALERAGFHRDDNQRQPSDYVPSRRPRGRGPSPRRPRYTQGHLADILAIIGMTAEELRKLL